MNKSQRYRFAQAPWYLIREYVGIYGVKMNYSKIKKLSVNAIIDAINHSRKIYPCFKTITRCHRDYYGRHDAWKMYLLKRVTNGHKNREFYEAIALRIDIAKRIETHFNSNKL